MTQADAQRAPEARAESLADLLGGRRGALDATLPSLVFVAAYLVSDEAIGIAIAAALVVAIGLGAWRLTHGGRWRAVFVGLLGVALGALIVLRTGRPEDFFLIRIATNLASALAWATSIVIRWPLLGVVVGLVLGQKAQWRRDPALLKAYRLGSYVWVMQYVIRVAVLAPLWYAGELVALGVAQTLLTWPLVAACLAVSWWIVRRALPPDHPGLRHPVVP